MSAILPDRSVEVSLHDRLQLGTALLGARVLRRLPPETMRRTMAWIATGAVAADYTQTKLARDQILTISAYCRGGTACLLRSIAVSLVCRLRGTWPTWAVGVLVVPPFAAHAWVEAEGRIVDEPMGQKDYRAFFTVPPSSRSTIRSDGDPHEAERR